MCDPRKVMASTLDKLNGSLGLAITVFTIVVSISVAWGNISSRISSLEAFTKDSIEDRKLLRDSITDLRQSVAILAEQIKHDREVQKMLHNNNGNTKR